MLKPHRGPVALVSGYIEGVTGKLHSIKKKKLPPETSLKSNKCIFPALLITLSSSDFDLSVLFKLLHRLICRGNLGKTLLGLESVAFGWHEYKAALKNRLLSP